MPTSRVTVFFANREPAGPYRVTVPAKRTRHVRFDQLDDPEPIPKDTRTTPACSTRTAPVVVQHTRLASRQADWP
jgi:hypothetical protein